MRAFCRLVLAISFAIESHVFFRIEIVHTHIQNIMPFARLKTLASSSLAAATAEAAIATAAANNSFFPLINKLIVMRQISCPKLAT